MAPQLTPWAGGWIGTLDGREHPVSRLRPAVESQMKNIT
jgi:hypothetical protein